MKAPLFIACRYLFSRRKKSVINVISWISLAGIAVGTAALIVVLSVYNGIGQVTQGLLNVFDPELSIEPAQGKTFHADAEMLRRVAAVKGVGEVSPIVEENAWLTFRHNEAIVQLRGVDDRYGHLSGLDTLVREGVYALADQGQDFVVLGGQIYYDLGLSSYTNAPLALHIPRRGGGIGFTMEEAFQSAYAYPSGAFFLQQDIDDKYVVAPIALVRRLMGYAPDEVTSLALFGSSPRAKERLQEALGKDYVVKDRYDQQPLYYKVFRSERIGVFLVLSLIVLIATLNLIASLSLLIIDKRKDIALLRAMGMEPRAVRRTFIAEGFLIALVGIGAGLLFGFLLCFAQQRLGLVRMGSNYIVDAFPVAMRWQDFAATTLVVSLLSLLAVLLTVKKSRL